LILEAILAFFECDREEEEAIVAYSKSTVAYLFFGWCDTWYKRGRKETPEQIKAIMDRQRAKL